MDGTLVKRITEIAWSELLASEQRDLFMALKTSLAAGEKFAAEQAEIFGVVPKKIMPPARPVAGSAPAPGDVPKRRRGRPPLVRAASPTQEGEEAHPPIRGFGGLPKEVPGYVSRDGHPDPNVVAELPADHPRNLRNRAKLKTGDADFTTAEAAIENGQLAEIFNPRG